jgi:ATP-dependent DNA helicase RecG
MQLDTPIKEFSGVGPRKAASFRQLGIETVWDLIHHYPSSHTFAPELGLEGKQIGDVVTVVGQVCAVWMHNYHRSLICRLDHTGHPSNDVQLTWFNPQYVRSLIHKGTWIIASGKLTEYGLTNPVFKVASRREALPPASALNTVTYPVVNGVTSKDIQRAIGQIHEDLWFRISPCYSRIHRSRNQEDYEADVRQIKYEELFYMQLGLALRQQRREQEPTNVRCIPSMIDIRQYFPFKLTDDQETAINDITRDMIWPHAMNRLLQGDVGSGKTVVAAYAAMLMAMNGGQTAILCPTQILAKQHYESIRGYFEAAGLKCELIIGPIRYDDPREMPDVVIGTTSILGDIQWNKLGLVIVDEQHKFGVEQRAALRKHGNPHCLVMTATPIPRTIAMTAFGDLSVSTIKEMPPGRKPVWTWHFRGINPADRYTNSSPYTTICNELSNGHQVYVVCPRIEALDDEMRAVEEVADEYASRFPTYVVSVLHGKMSPADKELAIRSWVDGVTSILVSTTVVEVGVDNPNATVMVVEGAERFGLAQLHQLRGRVGRSEHQSYCFLISDTESADGRKRLRTMERTHDGFEIAEFDLKLRGPGSLFSTEQHGLPNLRMADIVEDYELMLEARDDARECVLAGISASDQAELERRFGANLLLGDVG